MANYKDGGGGEVSLCLPAPILVENVNSNVIIFSHNIIIVCIMKMITCVA